MRRGDWGIAHRPDAPLSLPRRPPRRLERSPRAPAAGRLRRGRADPGRGPAGGRKRGIAPALRLARRGPALAVARTARTTRCRRARRGAGREIGTLISHRHRCIYVKVPKCASTAILEWFTGRGGGWHSYRPDWYGGLLAERARDLARLINLYPDYFTFSFVRNPYARFVSLWRHARRVASDRARLSPEWPGPEHYGDLKQFAELCAELRADFRDRWGRDARAFFRANGARTYGPARIELRHLRFVVIHMPPQTDFLPDCNPERLFGVRRINADPLSFVGTVETMEEDFARLAAALGLPDDRLPVRNASGKEAGGGYAGYYDAAARRLVEELYAEDLAFTGFTFDGARSAPAAPDWPPEGVRERPDRRRSPRTLPVRAWRRLAALEIMAEERLVRSPAAVRLLRPLKVLRGLPR
ncbi:MAG: sulfotransferase family protein [Holophagales bacterium]|nr:sulfotransferase family protein [Holophagales bacterium]MYH24297.1 sulfotransferase family protein [Holophagales bacterium]